MDYFEMPDLSMQAIAVMYQIKWKSRTNKPASFLVKEALASFVSGLEEDDVGFFYHPEEKPEICTHPGQLVGKILNSKLPYHFNMVRATEVFASLLNSLDDNYRKIGVIVTDCFEDSDASGIQNYLTSVVGADIFVFAIGNRCGNSLQEVCNSIGASFIKLQDVDEFEVSLKSWHNS